MTTRFSQHENIHFCCFFLYELLMSFWNSRKRPTSIILPRSCLWWLTLASDQLYWWPLFLICEVVVYENLNGMSNKELLNINEVKKHTTCLADKMVTFQLFHPKRTSQDNSWKIKRLTEPWAIAPTTKTMGSSFGITSFNFTRLSEWNEVPENK